jgi:RNA polymerase sigma factor (TIGR02999 family)
LSCTLNGKRSNVISVNSTVSQLLVRLRSGDQSAFNELMAQLYDELHRIAGRHIRLERSNHTLQATALVHEAYMKLFDKTRPQVADRVHFLAIASRVMRQVLVDHARARATKKRGGGSTALTTGLDVDRSRGAEQLEILELDRALEALALDDKNLAELIEMRYFGGMTAEETAEVLGRSVHTVRHGLRLAQAWLRRELGR